MTIEEMLKAGKTPDEMMRDLHDQIKEAQDKITRENVAKANEKRAGADLVKARVDAINAGVNYLYELGLIESKELEEDEFDDIYDGLVEFEEAGKEMFTMIKSLMKLEDLLGKNETCSKDRCECGNGNKSTDDIINDFLKRLK